MEPTGRHSDAERSCHASQAVVDSDKMWEAMVAADPSSAIVGMLTIRAAHLIDFWQDIINEVANSKAGDVLELDVPSAPKFFDE